MSKRQRTDDVEQMGRKLGREKEVKQHRARMDENQLITLVFYFFELSSPPGWPFWGLSELAELTDQPENFLRGVMEKLCIHIRKGPHKNQYILKPEYRSASVVRRMQEIEKKDQIELLIKQGRLNEDHVEKDANGSFVLKNSSNKPGSALSSSSSSSSSKTGRRKNITDDRSRFIEETKAINFSITMDPSDVFTSGDDIKFDPTEVKFNPSDVKIDPSEEGFASSEMKFDPTEEVKFDPSADDNDDQHESENVDDFYG